MLAGPTVRRLHRARGDFVPSPSGYYKRRVGQVRARTSGAQEGRRQRETTGDGAYFPPVRSQPPFSTISLLGLDQFGDVVVLDGELVKVSWRRPRGGEEWVEINKSRRIGQAEGLLSTCLERAFEQHSRAFHEWARQHHSSAPSAGVDQYVSRPDARTTEAIETFVHETLIPRLQAESSGPSEGLPGSTPGAPRPKGPALSGSSSPAGPASDSPVQRAVSELLQAFPRHFAFTGQSWFLLAPFFGRPRAGQFHLRRGQSEFVGMVRKHRAQAVERYDRLLEEVIVRNFRPAAGQETRMCEVYQGGSYAVIRSPGGLYFCCRRIPPYVVEGPDRKLYRFGAVQVGVPLTDVEAARVIDSSAARIVHPYRHMFVFGGGAGTSICMPRPEAYFRRVRKLPLEEALLQHLEATRMTLCSGYHAGNEGAPYHDIRTLGQKTITPEEARAQSLPIYRYFRGSR